MEEIKTVIDSDILNLENFSNDQAVRIGGLIKTCKHHKSKKGDPMAFLSVEDIFESVEVIVFPDAFSRCFQVLSSQAPVIVQGKIQKEERGPKIIAENIDTLADAREKYTERMHIRLDADKISRQKLEAVKKTLYTYHGNCPILITMHFPGRGEVDIEVLKDITVKPCRELTDALEEVLGYKSTKFDKKPNNLPTRKKWNNKKKD